MLHKHPSIQENSMEKNILDISEKPANKHCLLISCQFACANLHWLWVIRCFWWHIRLLYMQSVSVLRINQTIITSAESRSAGTASASLEHKDDSATLQTTEAPLHLRVQRHHQSRRARLEISLHFLSFCYSHFLLWIKSQGYSCSGQ